MAWSVLFTAVGLLLVFEGVLPFSSPNFWRQMMKQMLVASERALRIMGLVSMLAGLLVISITNHYFS